MECIFCKIIAKEVEAEIFYEDENSLAFLDINPRSRGMSIVIPKIHFSNFEENLEMAKKVFESALKVAEIIKKALKPKFVSISLFPSKIQHFHLRVYPFYEKEIPLLENQPMEVSKDELKEIAKLLRDAQKEEEEVEEREEKEPKEVERKRSEEEIYWIKREISLA